MSSNVCYEKDAGKKETQKCRDVKYDCCDKEQHYAAVIHDKNIEDRCCVKYAAGAGRTAEASRSKSCVNPRDTVRKSSSGGCSVKKCVSPASSKHKRSKISCGSPKPKSPTSSCVSHRTNESRRRRKLTPTEIAAKCYEVKREMDFERCVDTKWQNGKYCRDDCGSGIVARHDNFVNARKSWCKTPLSMYQATIGELARKILCREKILKRDVRPGPPCNVCEDILPPCRGYYRKYDCIRPCEEDYTYVKRGVKHYRNRIDRYWEPCMTREQKHKLDINSYAPHNSALAIKYRRERMGIPCW